MFVTVNDANKYNTNFLLQVFYLYYYTICDYNVYNR